MDPGLPVSVLARLVPGSSLSISVSRRKNFRSIHFEITERGTNVISPICTTTLRYTVGKMASANHPDGSSVLLVKSNENLLGLISWYPAVCQSLSRSDTSEVCADCSFLYSKHEHCPRDRHQTALNVSLLCRCFCSVFPFHSRNVA